MRPPDGCGRVTGDCAVDGLGFGDGVSSGALVPGGSGSVVTSRATGWSLVRLSRNSVPPRISARAASTATPPMTQGSAELRCGGCDPKSGIGSCAVPPAPHRPGSEYDDGCVN